MYRFGYRKINDGSMLGWKWPLEVLGICVELKKAGTDLVRVGAGGGGAGA